MDTRTLIIGLDGATFDLIRPWVKAGELPVLGQLMAEGVYGPLRSVYPVLSSSAWVSFMTGVNPGRHGLVDFVERVEGTYDLRLVHRSDIQSPTLWHWLSQQGKRVCVFNVPMTYPPEPVNGLMATGLGTPLYKSFTYPPELTENLRQRGYEVDKELAYHPSREGQYLEAVYEVCRKQVRVVKDLIATEAWDLFMYVFRDTDELAHFFWRHMDATHPHHHPADAARHGNALLNFYKFVDQNVGEMIAAAGDEVNIFVVSDHGFGPLYKDVFLNEWLASQGFLTKKTVAVERRLLARLGLTRSKISDLLRGLGLRRIENVIKDWLGERIAMLPRDERAEFATGIDWSRSRAYSFGYHGQIYLNLKGREPSGVVLPEDYESVREQVMAALRTLADPDDGQPVVDQIFKREELFSGPYLDKMPDLVVVMRDFSYITRNGYELGTPDGKIFCKPLAHESGSHRLEGILIAHGPAISRAAEGPLSQARLIDMAPTILRVMDCALPPELDGKVLQEMLDEAWCAAHLPRHLEEEISLGLDDEAVAWTDDDEAEVIQRLKNLGYLN